MQYADARFERAQPKELERVPFAMDELEMVPGMWEAIGWILMAFFVGVLFVGFLGL